MFDKLLDMIGVMINWFSGWWKRNIRADFNESDHNPLCFNCNEDNDACYHDLRCAALRDQLGVDINGDPVNYDNFDFDKYMEAMEELRKIYD